jgi:hypothetical protein
MADKSLPAAVHKANCFRGRLGKIERSADLEAGATGTGQCAGPPASAEAMAGKDAGAPLSHGGTAPPYPQSKMRRFGRNGTHQYASVRVNTPILKNNILRNQEKL